MASPSTEAPQIGEHAIIGDGRAAALVSRRAELDWLCWPRFDSPALFASLLDRAVGGHWSIAPTGEAQSSQRYLDDTNVLETRFATQGGTLTVTDFMPVDSEEGKRRHLVPQHELVRWVRCLEGEVEVEVTFDPRPDFGLARVRLCDAGPLGLQLTCQRHRFFLRGEARLKPRLEGGAATTVHLRAGQACAFSLTASDEAPAVVPPLGPRVEDALARTVAWWRHWARRAKYHGPYRDAVVRSALTLKLLVFAPSGAIVAAPTTSLPERPGGRLNWDYRYCWLRDAALTVRALYGLGYHLEAEAFIGWLVHTTRLSRPELHVLYDVYGIRPRRERLLWHLSGYAGARPVRVGNAASRQIQLDVYGEVIDAAAQLVRRGGRFDRETQGMLRDFGEWVCRHWSLPDQGIWEPRYGPRHHTHSRVLCWVALERLVEMHRRGAIQRLPLDHFIRNQRLLRDEVERRGFNPRLGSYTQTLDGDVVDASLLLLSWYGFERASSPRMKGTWRRIRERLQAGPGLFYRYEQSRTVGEGAFAFCSFWAVEYLARGGGTLAEADRLFGQVLRYANELGLMSEELALDTGAAWGNFPQAFSHVGLLSAALALEERAREERSRAERVPAPVLAAREQSP